MEPAALITTSRSPSTSLRAPRISVWAGSGPCAAVEALVLDLPGTGDELAGPLSVRRSPPPSPSARPARASMPSRASATSGSAECLTASRRVDVEVDERDVGVAEDGVAGGGEVGVAGADTEHDIGLASQLVGGVRARRAEAADRVRVVPRHRALAGVGVGDGDAGVASAKARSSVSAPEISGAGRRRRSAACGALRSSVAARSTAAGSGTGRPTCHTRCRRRRPASRSLPPARPAGSARVRSAPISTGSVSTRIAASAAGISCSGRDDAVEVLGHGAEGVVDGDVPAPAIVLPVAGGRGRRRGWRTCR